MTYRSTCLLTGGQVTNITDFIRIADFNYLNKNTSLKFTLNPFRCLRAPLDLTEEKFADDRAGKMVEKFYMFDRRFSEEQIISIIHY